MKFRENVMINTNQQESIIRKLPNCLKEHVSLGFFLKKNVKKIKSIIRKLPESLKEHVSSNFLLMLIFLSNNIDERSLQKHASLEQDLLVVYLMALVVLNPTPLVLWH